MIKVAKVLVENDERILLLKRSRGSKFFPELWDFPGGKIEPDETPEQSAKREAMEETSLEVEINKMEGDFDYVEQNIPIHFWVYSIKTVKGEVKTSQEHTEFRWVEKQNLKNYEVAPIVKLYFKL